MTKLIRLFLVLSAVLLVSAVQSRSADLLSPGFEPYGTVSWPGINGAADMGVGANVTLGITKNLALVGFGESDNLTQGFVDRFGGGLRYTAQLGSKVSLDAGVAGAYDWENPHFFLRLPLGATFTAYKSKNADLGLRVQYAFDISGQGPNGTSKGQLSFGPVANFHF